MRLFCLPRPRTLLLCFFYDSYNTFLLIASCEIDFLWMNGVTFIIPKEKNLQQGRDPLISACHAALMLDTRL